MDFYGKYKSPFGYYNNANQIDSYGVNHRGFTTRDELEYQFARQQRENELMNQCKAQGITENFPQYGANFWGNSANNYGFGTENIAENIRGMNQVTTPIPIGFNRTSKSSEQSFDNYLNERQRIDALRNGQMLNLHIANNPKANYNWPWYTWDWLGKYYINKYNDSIEKYAKQNNLPSDIVRAIMYNEAATGHKGPFNNMGDLFHISGSQMPMNIQGKTWENFQGKRYDTYIPEQNIELGVKLIKQIYNSLDNPTPDRIGTLWNETGANQINDVGARVKTAFETQPWL